MALERGARKRSGCSASRFCAEVAREICRRVAEGESVVAITSEPEMPSRSTVDRWAQNYGAFARALMQARMLGGRRKLGPQAGYCPATAEEIYERLCEGESARSICRDPAMPSYSTFHRWRRTVPEFGEMIRTAREVQAENYCELGWEMALEATPETAHLTRVRLGHLRWMAGHMAPAQFRIKLSDPPELPEPTEPRRRTLLLRHFQIERRQSDGWTRVVGFSPDPDTGRMVRDTPEDAPFSPPPQHEGRSWLLPGER